MAAEKKSPATTAVAKTTKPSAPALAEFNPRDPQTLLATAAQLAQFVTDNKLASTIQGRAYVQAEGWQFLFAVAGLDVICSKPVRLRGEGRPDAEICYEAEARLFDAQGREVGYGSALCSTAESSKRSWAEYAINSMAQTRAIGKAGRNRFAFVMKAAGFEPTPAEEMNDVGTSATVVPAQPSGNGAGASPTSSEPPVMRAESNSAAPVASTGADQSTSQLAGPAVIPAEVLAKFTQQFEACQSGIEIKALWGRLTKNEATALLGVKDAAKARVAQAAQDAAATAARTSGVKDAGTSTALVAEFIDQPALVGVEFTPATSEQRQAIERHLNHPLITRKEKTYLLLGINKLDTERARQAIIKLRGAIEDRENGDTAGKLREHLHKMLNDFGGLLGEEIVAEYSLLAENAEASIEQLRAALTEVRDVLSASQEPAEEPEAETTQLAA